MPVFHCRQFSLRQQQTAMRVCTDSLLFGAMAPVKTADRVLDIGAGSGLLALMAAQLGSGPVTAVELCPEASREAAGNFQNSPWADRLQAVNSAIQDYAACHPAQAYEHIISNPPFFAGHLKSATPQKRQARHTDTLPYPELIAAANRLLSADGLFYLLLPCHAVENVCNIAAAAGLHPHNRLNYKGFAHTPAKVAALTLGRTATPLQAADITVYAAAGVYTAESSRHLRGFLLRFAGEHGLQVN